MRYPILFLFVLFYSGTSYGQENSISLSGGYAFANIDEVEANSTGWSINFNYEFNAFQGKIAHGFGMSYISTSGAEETIGQQTSTFNLNSIPFYYAPKFFIGSNSFKGFIDGALGIHFSNAEKIGPILTVKDNNVGFYGGLGLGVQNTFNDKIFIKLQYQWAFMSNSPYRNGFMNNAAVGLGIKF